MQGSTLDKAQETDTSYLGPNETAVAPLSLQQGPGFLVGRLLFLGITYGVRCSSYTTSFINHRTIN